LSYGFTAELERETFLKLIWPEVEPRFLMVLQLLSYSTRAMSKANARGIRFQTLRIEHRIECSEVIE
jgi:hypothetical protein